jgi:uncharacterized protein with HEPN domain
MRAELLYLQDILDAAKSIRRFCAEITEDQFLVDELRQSAVLQKINHCRRSCSKAFSRFQRTSF